MSIVTHPANDAYRSGWDATFGKKEESKSLVAYPKDRPPRYNACTEPCDMWIGPCCCGAWHYGENDVLEKQ